MVLLCFFLFSCVSRTPIQNGIQPAFYALNPAAVIAVPAFILPDPSSNSSIDLTILESHKIVEKIESKIILAFSGQSNINGYPFNAVRQTLDKKQVKTLDILDKSLQALAGRFTSLDLRDRLALTPKCVDRKNFLEFYSFCVMADSKWVSSLNLLSSQIMNADSALLVFITNLNYSKNEQKYVSNLNLSVLLVDTNNGDLIWGNQKEGSFINQSENASVSHWDTVINNVLSDDFWVGFPGKNYK